jgi:hypothetical protein
VEKVTSSMVTPLLWQHEVKIISAAAASDNLTLKVIILSPPPHHSFFRLVNPSVSFSILLLHLIISINPPDVAVGDFFGTGWYRNIGTFKADGALAGVLCSNFIESSFWYVQSDVLVENSGAELVCKGILQLTSMYSHVCPRLPMSPPPAETRTVLLPQVRDSVREVVATYSIDDGSMELLVSLPSNYPLGGLAVESGKRVGVETGQLSFNGFYSSLPSPPFFLL